MPSRPSTSAWTPGGGALIGVLHLGELLGQPGFRGVEAEVATALRDAELLQAGGLDALIIENWRDTSPGPFVGPESVACLAAVARAVVERARVPVGINVLPNDYRAAFALARACGLAFVQLDVLVDPVRTDYSYSTAPPFEVRVDLQDLARTRERLGAVATPLLATVHPKHYALLEERTLERSVEDAVAAGAQGVVVTGTRTGSAPDPERVRRAKAAAGSTPVILGSGLDPENARALLPLCDGAIVGTALRAPDMGQVDPARVRALVAAARAATRP